jgi:hypothetical protein
MHDAQGFYRSTRGHLFATAAALAVGGAVRVDRGITQGQGTPRIIVDVRSVIRRKPPYVGGVNINGHRPVFATNAGGINFQGDLRAAHVKLVRTVGYPDDQNPGYDVTHVDRNVAAIRTAGALPLFIQYIAPGLPYLRDNGTTGGTVATNFLALVKHYLGPPHNLSMQYWEIGNEPDYTIDYRVTNPTGYTAVFNACHDALVAAGLRDRVVLCGPAVSMPYRWPDPDAYSSRIIDAVLGRCAHSIDVVTYHQYPAVSSAIDLLNRSSQLDALEDAAWTDDPTGYGVAALRARMDRVTFARPNVGIGITEYNTNSAQHQIASGLWNLALTHYYLYNPRGRIATAFVFDDYGAHGYGYYDARKRPDYNYWALWINGNLRGSHVLAYKNASPLNDAGRPALLVTATRESATVFVEVINRRTMPVVSHVSLVAPSRVGHPVLHTMANGVLPRVGRRTRLGHDFTYAFPPLSASIFAFPLV